MKRSAVYAWNSFVKTPEIRALREKDPFGSVQGRFRRAAQVMSSDLSVKLREKLVRVVQDIPYRIQVRFVKQ